MTVFDVAARMRFAATTLEDVSLLLAEHEDIFAGCSCPGADPKSYGPDEIGWTARTLRSKADQLESNKAASRREYLAPQLAEDLASLNGDLDPSRIAWELVSRGWMKP